MDDPSQIPALIEALEKVVSAAEGVYHHWFPDDAPELQREAERLDAAWAALQAVVGMGVAEEIDNLFDESAERFLTDLLCRVGEAVEASKHAEDIRPVDPTDSGRNWELRGEHDNTTVIWFKDPKIYAERLWGLSELAETLQATANRLRHWRSARQGRQRRELGRSANLSELIGRFLRVASRYWGHFQLERITEGIFVESDRRAKQGGYQADLSQVKRYMKHQRDRNSARKALVKIGRSLARELERNNEKSTDLLALLNAADGGGGPPAAAPLWQPLKAELQRIAIRAVLPNSKGQQVELSPPVNSVINLSDVSMQVNQTYNNVRDVNNAISGKGNVVQTTGTRNKVQVDSPKESFWGTLWKKVKACWK